MLEMNHRFLPLDFFDRKNRKLIIIKDSLVILIVHYMRVIRSILLCRGRWRDWLTAARTPGRSSRRQLPSCQGLTAARAWNVLAAARPGSPLPPGRGHKSLTAWPAGSHRCLPARPVLC